MRPDCHGTTVVRLPTLIHRTPSTYDNHNSCAAGRDVLLSKNQMKQLRPERYPCGRPAARSHPAETFPRLSYVTICGGGPNRPRPTGVTSCPECITTCVTPPRDSTQARQSPARARVPSLSDEGDGSPHPRRKKILSESRSSLASSHSQRAAFPRLFVRKSTGERCRLLRRIHWCEFLSPVFLFWQVCFEK